MYLYHLIPDPFIGTNLIPLNQMDKTSDLYKINVQKYEERKELLNVNIPGLNCKWNDVVHFSSINPTLIAQELLKINPDQKFRRAQYFRIHIDQVVDEYKAVVFHRTDRNKRTYKVDDSEITALAKDTYKELAAVPEATIEYWKDAKANNRPLLWFMHVPHILILGQVQTISFERCELNSTLG